MAGMGDEEAVAGVGEPRKEANVFVAEEAPVETAGAEGAPRAVALGLGGAAGAVPRELPPKIESPAGFGAVFVNENGVEPAVGAPKPAKPPNRPDVGAGCVPIVRTGRRSRNKNTHFRGRWRWCNSSGCGWGRGGCETLGQRAYP